MIRRLERFPAAPAGARRTHWCEVYIRRWKGCGEAAMGGVEEQQQEEYEDAKG